MLAAASPQDGEAGICLYHCNTDAKLINQPSLYICRAYIEGAAQPEIDDEEQVEAQVAFAYAGAQHWAVMVHASDAFITVAAVVRARRLWHAAYPAHTGHSQPSIALLLPKVCKLNARGVPTAGCMSIPQLSALLLQVEFCSKIYKRTGGCTGGLRRLIRVPASRWGRIS